MKAIQQQSKLGFSLIELSIVLLIIGIIAVGIANGSRIISEARLKSARALTTSSPVNSADNLTLWLETTLEKSLDPNIINGDLVSNWNNLNIQNGNVVTTTQSGSSRPTYSRKGMNSLPTLQFGGTNVFFNVNGAVIDNINSYSIFIVTKRNIAAAGPLLGNQIGDIGVIPQYTGNTSLKITHAADGADYPTITVPAFSAKPIILTLTSNNPTGAACDGDTLSVYTNGSPSTPITICAYYVNNSVAIGYHEPLGTDTYNGDISEIIIFDRMLKTHERQAIEQYLGQKWGIAVSS